MKMKMDNIEIAKTADGRIIVIRNGEIVKFPTELERDLATLDLLRFWRLQIEESERNTK